MRRMDFYLDGSDSITLSSDNYNHLLEYKRNYVLLCNDLLQFYQFDLTGRAIAVDMNALSEYLRPFAENIAQFKLETYGGV